MEKNTKSNLRKGLLMATACVLVAAISISATLSYLTAKSNTKTNTFRSEAGIDGALVEPHFNMNETNYFSPGEYVDKDPSVKNTSSANESMFTGIRLKFFLNPGGTGKVQVDETTFLKFVAIYNSYNSDSTKTAGYNTTNWTEMTSTSKTAIETPTASAGNVDDFSSAANYSSLAKYFKYKTTLAQNDTTNPIFKSVKPNGNILIPATDTALSGRTTKFATTNEYGGKAYSAMTDDEKRTFLSYVGDHLTDTYYFDSFDFEIDIDGYGVKYDSGNASADELGDVIQTITDGLAGM